ncbi:substrate-binding domain-containing protein [Lacrimispora algidixylanolytica]|uniref:Tungsten ABC transporter substrate-binding protein n=1 Tax=Lacrimispora algidixylanolytica TaxID=94868 RepID=A0A419T0U7_9FIRM|nr:substrate-binding domain-containing protein [Lacrimispora algidixylanolytica]RKD31082.1 tungsten ABC transporter substrate-binding protein [Lacrimispora algidixylanolytica]
MKFVRMILLSLMVSTLLMGCGTVKTTETTVTTAPEQAATGKDTQVVPVKGKIILSTTTSTQDSGLLDVILPDFTKKTGWEVDTVAVGTGEALKMGENGEADVLLVHAKSKEEEFIKAGYGVKRYDVMYNDFVVVGPTGKIDKNEDVKTTFQAIFDNQYPFVSRGDDSGTNTKELSIWKTLNLVPDQNLNYISSGQGMGATLLMADEKGAYTLSDRATWLTTKKKTSMDIICEKDTQLLNYYGVIAVNPQQNSKINEEGAKDFVDWILSDDTQTLIGSFGMDEYGQSLFTPNAGANK